jgi:murein DD-endopeptidase MepM/ murein hydrolase activator NlpD
MARLPFKKTDITAEFGETSAYRSARGMQPHSGTDFAPRGSRTGRTKIPSVASGTIRFIKWSDILGWVIVQTVWDIKENKTLYVGYCHISCNDHGMNCKGPRYHGDHAPVNKKVGSRVKEGQTMAYMGNTGSASSGVHLHITISDRLKGVYGATSDKFDIVKWVDVQRSKKKAEPSRCPTCNQTI